MKYTVKDSENQVHEIEGSGMHTDYESGMVVIFNSSHREIAVFTKPIAIKAVDCE